MKYWIFQNNQVLGPYEPDEMEKIPVFSPETLVCPEGRRGTSMGDWQRAGMVPDLSVALVRTNASGGTKTATLSIAGLPPEPTLKDLAQIGSIQEKVSLLEQVVIQLQEGLRAKDVELSAMHQELAGKSREASEIKGEAASRQREADELKRQISGFEDRLASVRLLSETLDKAVEEERKVEQDVEKQGKTLTELAREVEDMRRQLEESKALRPEPAAAAPPTPPLEFPTIKDESLPSFPASMPSMPSMPSMLEDASPKVEISNFDPMAFGAASAGALAPDATAAPPEEAPPIVATEPPPSPPVAKGKKALLIGAVLGLAALGALAIIGGFVPGLGKPKTPAVVLEPTPLPPPEPAPLPVAAAPDSRQLAIEFAKQWPLPGDRTLERALENLAPSTGNLSPWMADPLPGNRMQVNYFARSSAPGAPTIAYEFEVDLDGKTLVGRNAAAKSVLTGKAAAPPAPPKPKPVRVKPKTPKPKKAPEAVNKAPEEETLDSMLGDPPAKAASKAPAKEEASMPGFGNGSTMIDSGEAPASAEEPRPAHTKPPRRASKAKGGKASEKDQPADKTLLDDLLKE